MKRDSMLLVGTGYWARSLAEGLSDAGLEVEVAPLDSLRDALTPATWKRVAKAAVVVRIGFRPGAKTWRGLAFDMAMRIFTSRMAKTCCYWIGTDVMHLAEDGRKRSRVGSWRSPAFSAHQHIAGSESLRRELVEVGIGAKVVPVPWRTVNPPSPLPPFPERFTIASYVPDSRSDFYGGPILLACARRLPSVRFEVMGGIGSWARDTPPNMVFLGWVSDPSELYARSSCVIRLTEHDSIGGTALEGLLFGRPVIHPRELIHTEKVERTTDAVVAAIERLVNRHEQGMLEPQEQAAAWARQEVDHVRLFAQLASCLQSFAESGSQPQPRVTYLTLQATSEGQAAHAHVHEIVKGLAENGWCVRLIEPDYGPRVPSAARRLLQFARLQVSVVLGLRRGESFYVRTHFAAYPAALAARLLRVPVVQEVNGPHFEAFLVWPALRRVRRAVVWLSRSQLRMANAVITVTPQLVNWIAEDAGVIGANLVSNGADTERFRPGVESVEELPKRFVVFFGALAPWQGVAVAIEATRAKCWPDDVALVIVGDGMLREDVELAADGDRVIYLGQRPYGEMPAIVGSSIASLIPKFVPRERDANTLVGDHSETGLAPIKLFESMACGVPVIASDLPGLAETISAAGCGILVKPGDPMAIAQAIGRLANSPALAKAMGDRGRQSAVREHSWKSRADATAAVLHSIGVPAP